MAKKNNQTKFQKRDWVIVALFLAIVATNWIWYQNYKTQLNTEKSNSAQWLQLTVKTGWLQHCINDNVKPCDFPMPISPASGSN